MTRKHQRPGGEVTSNIIDLKSRKPFKNEKPLAETAALTTREAANVAFLIGVFNQLKVIEIDIDAVYSPIQHVGMDIDEKNTYSCFAYSMGIIGISPSAKEIESLSRKISEFDHEINYFDKKVGLFFTALIELSQDKEFTLHLLDETPAWLCFGNMKNVTINGNPSVVGIEMTAGRVTINGKLDHVGLHFSGGEMHVNGELKEIPTKKEGGKYPYYRGGKVYVNGALVFDGGTYSENHCPEM